ncbi:MAG TPA: HAD family phosphatase [Syntrophales bacterium]|nr:HAD family phosphatase [Syntrophales bacterium]HPX12271.1 HAD family phosphatase [Syntrophales bacterium]HQB30249.1 HAD family phosphatase [Syntrophales bacterium]HQN77010.1 HAD family phosphatase [Syntrophales bacterium]HQQ26379.1 HAD family phosphatase [Syntrophales bacterium]
MAIVFIDLDGTLIEKESSERLFFLYLLRKGALGIPQISLFLFFALRRLPRLGKSVWKKNKAYLSGLSEEYVAERAGEFVGKELLPSLRREMTDRISRHRQNGDETVLLTGTLAAIAEPVARHGGIDAVRATVCAVSDGRFRPLPPPVHPFHAEKLRIARRMCAEKGISLRECTAYGDSIHDLPLLEAVGKPVAVCPDRALKRIALSRSWEILGESPSRRRGR